MGDIRLARRSSATTDHAQQQGIPWKETLPMTHNPNHARIRANAANPASLSLEPAPISAFTAHGSTTPTDQTLPQTKCSRRWIRNYNSEDRSSPKIRCSSSAVSQSASLEAPAGSSSISPWNCPRFKEQRCYSKARQMLFLFPD
jgi:hypothetical protein